MRKTVYRYRLEDGVPLQEVEETILLAVLAAESLHGEARVRLDASYRFNRDKRVCVIDAGTEVGRDVCRLFTGLAIKEFGRDSFQVERITPSQDCPAVCQHT